MQAIQQLKQFIKALNKDKQKQLSETKHKLT